MNKIDWIITGTKKSHAGPEPLLWNDLTINNEDKSLYGLAQNEFVIGLSQTERRSLYRLYTSRVAYSDAMRPGAWLAIGLAIPRGYRLCDKKSPYDLLMKMYATFLDFCMERGADGCYRFKNEDDYSSFKERFSLSTIQPDRTAKTDSKLISNVALVGSVFFCATICKVYAMPLDKTPAYKISHLACHITVKSGFSKINAKISEIIPTPKNCKQLIFTGFAPFSIK